jgi:glutamate transport system substrate-binding protein
MDVDVARYVAKKLKPGRTSSSSRRCQRPARDADLETGQVEYVVGTYSITDARKQKVVLRRTVLHRRPGPAGARRRLLDHRPSRLERQEAVLGQGLDLGAAERQEEGARASTWQEFDTYSECVASARVQGNVDALTTDDTILAGYAAQDQYKGKLKVVGAPFTKERYGVGLKKGDKAPAARPPTRSRR